MKIKCDCGGTLPVSERPPSLANAELLPDPDHGANRAGWRMLDNQPAADTMRQFLPPLAAAKVLVRIRLANVGQALADVDQRLTGSSRPPRPRSGCPPSSVRRQPSDIYVSGLRPTQA